MQILTGSKTSISHNDRFFFFLISPAEQGQKHKIQGLFKEALELVSSGREVFPMGRDKKRGERA